MKILPLSKNGYQTYPLRDSNNNEFIGVIEISEEDYQKLQDGSGCFNTNLTAVVDYYETEEEQNAAVQLAQSQLRSKRQIILEAFDKYKINVYYGITQESDETKAQILEWYQNLLDLNESAFTNIPEVIQYYLPTNFTSDENLI